MTHHTHTAPAADLIDGDVVIIDSRTYTVVGVPTQREDGVVVLTADAERDGVQHTFHLSADRVDVLCALDHPDFFADAAADATGPAAGAEHVPGDDAPRACDRCQGGMTLTPQGETTCSACQGWDALQAPATADHATPLLSALDTGETGATEWVDVQGTRAVPRTIGFLVGLPEHGLRFTSLAQVDEQTVAYWARDTSSMSGVVTLGAWIDSETGTVHFDACDWHAAARSALDAAAERGERAVWDLSGDGREVRADGTVAASDVRVGDLILPTFDGGMRPGIPVRVTSIYPAHATPDYVRFTFNGRVTHAIPGDARVTLSRD